MTTRWICTGAVLSALCTPAYAQLQQEPVEAMMIATGSRDPMPIIEERLKIMIDGQHASTTLLQVAHNQTGGRVEGRYRLRAGGGSHVDGFAYWNGETKIVGEVFEKQTAREVYERVTSRRRDPGLLEQEGEGLFGFRVFPIEANEKKRVELRWSRWLERRGKVVTYRAPVTRADAEIVIAVTGAVKNVTSSTHRLHTEKVSGGVRLRSDGARSTGQLIVSWEVDEPDWQPSAYVHPGGKHDGWFALSLAAPKVVDNAVAAKDVTIVVDRSGSMTGDAIVHAREAAADMVRTLGARDRVNVIAFSDEVDPLFAAPQPADDDTRTRAIGFIERLKPGGGTDIALALKTAIKSQERGGERPRVVVFMTDGQSDVNLAVQAANADTGDVRLFTLGLGKDVNKPLLARLAAQKRGRFIYIEDFDQIRREVSRLASSIAKPLLVDVSIDVEGAQGLRVYPRTLPDLFAEDELFVTGRLRGTGTAKFVVRGRLAGKEVTYTRSVDLAKAPARPWVGALWAKWRVDHLLEEISLGAKDPEVTNEVLDLALAYNFVTPYTSFLAIPESELGDMRGTVEAARARKAKIVADNPDVAELNNADKDSPRVASIDPSGASAPDYSGDGGGDDEEDSEGSPISASGRVDKRGCAGCATTGGEGGLVLLVAVALLLRRRRR